MKQMIKKAFSEFRVDANNRINDIWFSLVGNNVYEPTDNLCKFIDQGYFNSTVSTCINSILITRAVKPKLKLFKGYGDDKEEIIDHPLLQLMKYPNSKDCYQDFISQWLVSKKVCGFAPIYGFKPSGGLNSGKVKELRVLPPQNFKAVASGNKANPISHYECDVIMDIDIEEDDVYISRYFDPRTYNDASNFIFGLSPLRAAWIQIVKNNAVNETEYTQFVNGMVKSLLCADGPINLTDTQEKSFDSKLSKEAQAQEGVIANVHKHPTEKHNNWQHG